MRDSLKLTCLAAMSVVLFTFWKLAEPLVGVKYALYGVTLLLVLFPLVLTGSKGAKIGAFLGFLWALMFLVSSIMTNGYAILSVTSGIVFWGFILTAFGAILGKNLDNKKVTLFLLAVLSAITTLAGVWLW